MVGGGLLAQLVQELLLCCQSDGEGAGGRLQGGDESIGGSGERMGGAGVARIAAGCLNALCSFTPAPDVWRRFLPGTFSGLFRAIRGMQVEAYPASARYADSPALTAISSKARVGLGGGVAGGGVRRGGSKSALAETCLATLAKVLLMCGGSCPASSNLDLGRSDRQGPRLAPSVAPGAGIGATGGGAVRDINDSDPLMVLRQLALTSNASVNAADGSGGDASGVNTTTRPSTGIGSTAAGELLLGNSGAIPSPANTTGGLRLSATTLTGKTDADLKWEIETSGRLRVLLPPLFAFCRLHPGWRVRRATAEFAASLLAGGGWRGDRNRSVDRNRGMGDGGDKDGNGIVVRGEGRREEGLLGPLTPLLMEALVGLFLDDMPQVRLAMGSLMMCPRVNE